MLSLDLILVLLQILHWVWGHQTKIAPINISTHKEIKLFFASGPVGVCYDWIKNEQNVLLGHVSISHH